VGRCERRHPLTQTRPLKNELACYYGGDGNCYDAAYDVATAFLRPLISQCTLRRIFLSTSCAFLSSVSLGQIHTSHIRGQAYLRLPSELIPHRAWLNERIQQFSQGEPIVNDVPSGHQEQPRADRLDVGDHFAYLVDHSIAKYGNA